MVLEKYDFDEEIKNHQNLTIKDVANDYDTLTIINFYKNS